MTTTTPADRPGQYLSMPDPCPHITRMALIRARLNDPAEADRLFDHLQTCRVPR
ncbi:MAG: hypothetical protein ABWZ17_06375 [Candidatus Binatia bacterium]